MSKYYTIRVVESDRQIFVMTDSHYIMNSPIPHIFEHFEHADKVVKEILTSGPSRHGNHWLLPAEIRSLAGITNKRRESKLVIYISEICYTTNKFKNVKVVNVSVSESDKSGIRPTIEFTETSGALANFGAIKV